MNFIETMVRNHQSNAFGEPNPPEEIGMSSDEESEDESVFEDPMPPLKKQKTPKQTVRTTLKKFYIWTLSNDFQILVNKPGVGLGIASTSGAATKGKKAVAASVTSNKSAAKKRPKVVPSTDPDFEFECEGPEVEEDKIQHKMKLSKQITKGNCILFIVFL